MGSAVTIHSCEAANDTNDTADSLIECKPKIGDRVDCFGVACGNSGSILSYVATSLRETASELELMASKRDFGTERFHASDLSENLSMVLPQGGMIAKKLPDGDGFVIRSMDCRGTAVVAQGQKVARCKCCAAKSRVGNKHINRVVRSQDLP